MPQQQATTVYVFDFPNFAGQYGEDTIVVKAKNQKEAFKVIKYYFPMDYKEKIEKHKRYCTTLLELKEV